ncbi:unnamed protein product [Parnassius apollo]|uniref:(apollo) hypothetical protein n=1 Tax=Parnassius apollo TaxID=110799 RepID=A0A8S3X7U2_PARAO|nr:unnamed protein product [Parnassius apollo]
MQPVGKDIPPGRYFIPHHCVIRPERLATKLRVVFNASHKTTNGLSLNDIVDLVDIITGFRIHNIVFTCDISELYRQIVIRPEDRVWQHVLWRKSPSLPVQEFELRTVTYGVKSSPYLAIRTLHKLATDHGDQFPHAAEALRHHTYMDDIITGASSIEATSQLKEDLINRLNCAQLDLRKWSSNSPLLLQTLPMEHWECPKSFSDDGSITLKVLGVQWDPTEDYFTYSVSPVNVEFTKRSILSHVARIYDPLGWLSPFILLAKLLLQSLWRIGLSWNELIPANLRNDWVPFVSDLYNIKSIKIPRKTVILRCYTPANWVLRWINKSIRMLCLSSIKYQ